MQLSAIQRVLGLLLMIFSLSMLPPALVGWHYGDGEVMPFLHGFVLVLGVGLLAWWPVRRERRELKLRDGFLIVVLFWTVLSLSGAVLLLALTK